MKFRRRPARYDVNIPPSGPPMTALPGACSRSAPGPFDALALYNSERERGLVHTAEWDARMAALQAEFDDWAAHFNP